MPSFRETVEKVKHYQAKGALAVEMELSAIFTVAGFRGWRPPAFSSYPMNSPITSGARASKPRPLNHPAKKFAGRR
jgi:uridine phosphorylase